MPLLHFWSFRFRLLFVLLLLLLFGFWTWLPSSLLEQAHPTPPARVSALCHGWIFKKKVCDEARVKGLASTINRGSIFHRGVGGCMRLARWESYFLRAHREAESERKWHLHTVMTERDVKTPIRDINYIQVESVDYTQVMKDFALYVQAR